MMIADYDHHELDVVRMELSGDALAKWMKDPQGESRGRAHPIRRTALLSSVSDPWCTFRLF